MGAQRFLYDRETLQAILERSGSRTPSSVATSGGANEAPAGIEGHGVEDGNRPPSEFETMILGAPRV